MKFAIGDRVTIRRQPATLSPVELRSGHYAIGRTGVVRAIGEPVSSGVLLGIRWDGLSRRGRLSWWSSWWFHLPEVEP